MIILSLSISNSSDANALNSPSLLQTDISLDWQLDFNPLLEQPELFDIVINEFIPRPTTESGYIELLNISPKQLNLNKWILGIGNNKITIDYTQPINPGDIIIIGPEAPTNTHGINTHYVNLDYKNLPKTQGSIWISSNEAVLIDSIRYDRIWSDKILDGRSLEKVAPSYIGVDVQNWIPHPFSNSFGFENDALDSQSFELELLSAVVEQDSIIVRFNYHIQDNSDSSIKVRGAKITNYDWNLWNGSELKFKLADINWVQNESAYLEVDDINIFGDEAMLSFEIEIAHPPAKGDLTINEILYHPIKDRYASFNDQSEYVEIKNHRPFKISLKNIIIRDGLDKFGKYRSWTPINSVDWSVPGHDYAVIFADTASNVEDAQLMQFFEIDSDHSWGQVKSSTLGLVISGREIFLTDKNGMAFDSVFYSPEMHHPLVRDTKGRSLEKIENLATSTGTKWSTSAHILGGTPGEMNSNNIPNDESHNKSALQIQPNPFSPDHDGLNDVTVINLSLNEPGYLIRMSIFDRYGYRINDLINDEIIGTNYSTYWDGTDSSGNLLGTGVYIIWINAIHRENKSELNYKKPLVLVRKK